VGGQPGELLFARKLRLALGHGFAVEVGGGVVVGVRCVTEQMPLQVCQPTHFIFQLMPPEPQWPGQFITILLTDREHKVIGQISSQRVGLLTTSRRLAQLLDPINACPP
jgi:hypothetical protein